MTRFIRHHLSAAAVAAMAMGGGACTDLTLDGDEQLSCASSADCPEALLCAPALGRCVAEDIVAEAAIAVDGQPGIDAPRISRVEGFARTVVDVTFTKEPVGDVVVLVDNRLELPCEVDAAEPKRWRCAFDARDFPDEGDGFYDLIVVATDAAGNEARARARVELDTVAPALAPASDVVTYTLVDDAIVRDVGALGPATRVTVQLSLTEATAGSPTLTLADGDRLVPMVYDVERSAGPLHVFSLDGAAAADVADGTHALVVSVVDDVGNADALTLDAVVVVDGTAPSPPAVETSGALTYERRPWGTRAAPAPSFRVSGAAGAVEANASVVVTSGESLSSTLLGVGRSDDVGAFDVGLEIIDLPRVFARVVDDAGNVGPAAAIKEIVWVASLGERRRGDAFSNPHVLSEARAFVADQLSPNLRSEPLRAGDLVDGDGVTVTALTPRVALRREATNQPTRMAHAAGYLPTIGAPVLFGGVPARNASQTTSTFVLRNDIWTQVFDEPPAHGPLAWDPVRQELVSVLVNGETWGFDGIRWAQLPVDDLPTVARGPIAYDLVAERLVTVQGRETWVLDTDDVWTRLPGEAPMPGLAIFDGVNTVAPGAVLGFDAVDGHVLLHGEESPGVGAVYALIDDVWARLGDAPPTVGATAVEDLETGRVHFVCRSERGAFVGTDGTMLTWDGTAMVRGPVNPEPNSGCAATHDLVRRRLLVHGGTGDGQPNVQALPQRSVATLDAGSSTWVLDFLGNAPAATAHNGGGAAHYNPVLDTVVIHGAATSNNLARITTLLTDDGFNVLGTNNGNPLFNMLPFFDGARSRMIEGSSAAFWNGSAWVREPNLPFFINGEPTYTHDEDADAAFAYSGFFDGSVETFRLRGTTRTILSPSTSPPSRRAPTLAFDPVGHRVVLVGGSTQNNTGLMPDAWVFEAGDWRQIDDMPLDVTRPASFTDVGRHQLVFDRGRGVITGLFDGALFELIGDSWVLREVETTPRANSLMVYDAFEDRLLFIGALDFERSVNTIVSFDVGATRAASIATFDLGAIGASDDAVIDTLAVQAVAGASGADSAGASLLVWGTSSFVPLADNEAPAEAPAPLGVVDDGDVFGRALGRRVHLAVASPPTGNGPDATIVLQTCELVVRYQEP